MNFRITPTKALVIAFVVTGLDFVFHLFFTFPMETLFYFVAKFLIGFAAAFTIPRLRLIYGSFFFAIAFSAIYYPIAYYSGIPGLTEYTAQPITLIGIPNPMIFLIAEFFVHWFLYFIGALVVVFTPIGDKR
ncbi:MAG TPA: hypothetical protein VGS11_10825 [Candidatus Bathyarchaeia archaeon]|nr:hypothetical protein [Candidatus Bathyarchaeia archaeon]